MFVVHVILALPQNRAGCQPVRQDERKEPILSTEEIVNTWKNNEDDANKLPKDKKLQGKLKPKGKTPANPAGAQEITDEELKAVEGGLTRSFSCVAVSC
jgi:mersacidin/lichenicidin family type 2 lantibiotic